MNCLYYLTIYKHNINSSVKEFHAADARFQKTCKLVTCSHVHFKHIIKSSSSDIKCLSNFDNDLGRATCGSRKRFAVLLPGKDLQYCFQAQRTVKQKDLEAGVL